jgi:hypothetical protein
MTHRGTRATIVVLGLFIGLTAVVSAFTVVPGLPRDWLESGPFADYTVPALALGVIGGLALVAALAAIVRSAMAGAVAIVAGIAMVVFELVQIAVIGLALAEYGIERPEAWLQIVYIMAGSVLAAAGESLWQATAEQREHAAPWDTAARPRRADPPPA